MQNRNCASEHHTMGHLSQWLTAALLCSLVLIAVITTRSYQPSVQNGQSIRRDIPFTPAGRDEVRVADGWTCSHIHVLAGDRLVVASLDKHARLHEVQIQCIDEMLSDNPSTLELHKCVDISTAYCRSVSGRTRDNGPPDQSAVNGINNIVPGGFAVSELQPPDTFATPPRSFRLPHFIEDQSLAPGSGPHRQHCVDQFVQCHTAAESPGVRVYVADDVFVPAPITGRLAAVVQRRLDDSAGTFPAAIADLDRDEHLSIVIGELSSGKRSSEPPLLGCVRAEDFLEDSPLGGDIIYLDYRLVYRPDLLDVLVHEMAHAAVFCRIRTLRDNGIPVCDIPSWLNEAIAHSCEYQRRPGSPNLSMRISRYLTDSGRWPLIPPRQNSRGISARGPVRAAGLFFVESQLADQSLQELVDRILFQQDQSANSTDESFAQLFREWTIWMSRQQSLGRLPLKIRRLPGDGTTAPLTVRGTAATWWAAPSTGLYSISAPENSELQITVIRCNGERLPVPVDVVTGRQGLKR